jgi:hypothetical protein
LGTAFLSHGLFFFKMEIMLKQYGEQQKKKKSTNVQELLTRQIPGEV